MSNKLKIIITKITFSLNLYLFSPFNFETKICEKICPMLSNVIFIKTLKAHNILLISSTLSCVLFMAKSIIPRIDLITFNVSDINRSIKESTIDFRLLWRSLICFNTTTVLIGHYLNLIDLNESMLLIHGNFASIMANLSFIEFLKIIFREKRPSYNTFIKETGGLSKIPTEIFESFPSGHTSVAFNASVFGLFIFNKIQPNKFFMSIISFLFVSFGVFVGYSRHLDNKHHIHDILVGGLLGILTGYIFIKTVARKSTFISKNK